MARATAKPTAAAPVGEPTPSPAPVADPELAQALAIADAENASRPGIYTLFGQWTAARAGMMAADDDDTLPDKVANALLFREEEIARQIVATAASSLQDLSCKVEILRSLLGELRDNPLRPDRLELLFLASIECDIEALLG